MTWFCFILFLKSKYRSPIELLRKKIVIWKTLYLCGGSLILFSWRVNGHFRFAWSVNEDLFFPWFVNLYFSVLGKLGLNFFVICEIHIYFCVIFEPTTFAGITFPFFLEILASLKLVNYTNLDVNPAHSMSLRMEDWELTTATATYRA